MDCCKACVEDTGGKSEIWKADLGMSYFWAAQDDVDVEVAAEVVADWAVVRVARVARANVYFILRKKC